MAEKEIEVKSAWRPAPEKTLRRATDPLRCGIALRSSLIGSTASKQVLLADYHLQIITGGADLSMLGRPRVRAGAHNPVVSRFAHILKRTADIL